MSYSNEIQLIFSSSICLLFFISPTNQKDQKISRYRFSRLQLARFFSPFPFFTLLSVILLEPTLLPHLNGSVIDRLLYPRGCSTHPLSASHCAAVTAFQSEVVSIVAANDINGQCWGGGEGRARGVGELLWGTKTHSHAAICDHLITAKGILTICLWAKRTWSKNRRKKVNSKSFFLFVHL